MNAKQACTPVVVLTAAALAFGQQATPSGETAEPVEFEAVAGGFAASLEESVAELAELRQQMADEMIPLSRELSRLEAELTQVRDEFAARTRLLDGRLLDLSNLGTEIKSRKDEATYLGNLFSSYATEFENRLHVVERERYAEALETAMLAGEDSSLSESEVFQRQASLLFVALERLQDALGGTSFEGTAVDPDGLVNQGTFVLVGPYALFRSADGVHVGTAEQRIGSVEPAILTFATPEDSVAADTVVRTSEGLIPLDPSLGNAHQIEATESETLWQEIQKGGPVMAPIFAMASAAFLVALLKWLSLVFLRKPSRKRVNALLDAVADGDEEAANEAARRIKGPTGRMLAEGVAHLRESRELVEEVMYETVLRTKLKLQRFLPFIAICAASAPLLGLLGTVTGIISTFKLITLFGSGDVRLLSGGISEALITTKYGLIVAIPSLLLHAFLARKVRAIVGQMETSAVALVNQLGRSAAPAPAAAAPAAAEAPPAYTRTAADSEAVRAQVKEILSDMLVPTVQENLDDKLARAKASQSR